MWIGSRFSFARCLLFLNTKKAPTRANIAPTETAMPIPAFAPVLKPLVGFEGPDCAGLVGDVPVAEEEGVVERNDDV